jgi:transcriptional regulator with XRE-family HTH domain
MSNKLNNEMAYEVLTHVSGNLRRLRQAAGLSQSTLAKLSGVSRGMIVAVEAGAANISLASLDKIAAAMNVGFVDLVRNPERESQTEINEVIWRGNSPGSKALLLCSAPASVEIQLCSWVLGPGERYDAEPDPPGRHEMIYVTEGSLRLHVAGVQRDYESGSYAAYSTSQAWSYANPSDHVVRFVVNVIA